MRMPQTAYTVLTDFNGFCNAGDTVEDREQALEQYEFCTSDEQPARVIRMDFDVETGVLETARDVTEDFAATVDERRRDAGYTAPDTQEDDAYDLWRAYAAE